MSALLKSMAMRTLGQGGHQPENITGKTGILFSILVFLQMYDLGMVGPFSEATFGGKSYCTDPGTKNKSRQVTFVADMVADHEELDNPDSLEMLVGVQWQVYRVSPLWGIVFSDEADVEEPTMYEPEMLKSKALVIGAVVGDQTEVELAPLPGLRGSRFDKEALVITVRRRMGGKRVSIFMGILCATEAKELQLRHGKAISLPVMLAQGNQEVMERVIHGMEKAFDCVVGKLTLPERELQWMAAMWSGIKLAELKRARPNYNKTVSSDFDQLLSSKKPTTRSKAQKASREEEESGIGTQETLQEESIPGDAGDRKQAAVIEEADGGDDVRLCPIKLVYGMPASLGEEIREQIGHFTFEFPAEEVRQIWKCCRDVATASEFTEEEMESFHRFNVCESIYFH